MKQLDVNKILDAVKKARYQYANGTLNQDIQNSTTPEFWSQTRNSTLKKQQIIQLAKSNHPRPHSRKHPLGFALNNYTDPRKSTYDPKFTKQIKSLAPHWFITRSGIASGNKQQLLLMAKNKQPRPNSKTNTLGRALVNYTNNTGRCYDPIFTNKIKKVAPHWFKK
jgi:hypothetical protein